MRPPNVQDTEICCEFFWTERTGSIIAKISGALPDCGVAGGLPTLLVSTPLLGVLIQLGYLHMFVNELRLVKCQTGNGSDHLLR